MLSSKDIYRILAPHNGQSLMASGQPYFERIEQYAPTTYQYELFGNTTDLYLVHQGRITHPALLKAQEAFIAQQPPSLQISIVDYAETLTSNSPEVALQHTIDYKQNMDRLLPKAGEKPKNAHYRG